MRELASKKKVLIVSFLLIILMIYYIGTYYSDGLYHNKTNYGAYIFYTLNSFLPFYLLLAFLSNNLVTSNFYQNKYSKFQNMIIPSYDSYLYFNSYSFILFRDSFSRI